jgi:hypothetical protein
MAYQLDRYNNTLLTTVEDGTIDQTTDLKFIGKNYAGYGEIQNENFLYLLENFSGANQPARPLSGQVWFDSGNSKLKFYDGTKFRTTGGAEVSDTEPSGLSIGDFWWDTANDQLYVWNGTEFVLIGPQSAGAGITTMQSIEVVDTLGTTRRIIAATIDDEIVFIISPVEFTLGDASAIPGFDVIKAGTTLKNTQAATNGVTTRDPDGDPLNIMWGTASDSLRLGGLLAEEYITQSDPTFDSTVHFPYSGITFGDNYELKVYIDKQVGSDTRDWGIIEHDFITSSKIGILTTDATGASVNSATFTERGMQPGASFTYNLGTTSLRWQNIYAREFIGLARQATAVVVQELTSDPLAPVTAEGNIEVVNESVAVRDALGNLKANLFQGTATQARYADLAEKYTTCCELPVGTAVAVCDDEEHEVGPAKASQLSIGVVSAEPAIMMNSEADGQYIGLKGRLPVRVNGPVKKGQAVYAWQDGVCSTIQTTGLVGIALETNMDDGEKLVECVLKV